MKLWYVGVCMLFFSCAKPKKHVVACRYDKGIKTAIISAQIEGTDRASNGVSVNTQTIHYNENGQPLSISYADAPQLEHHRIYDKGKLQFIINSRKKNSEEAEREYVVYKRDTTVTLSYHTDGRPLEIRDHDGSVISYIYTNCEEELQTLMDQHGDTLHQLHSFYKDDVLATSIWTPFIPVKSSIHTKYFAYEFDANGHWIKRKYSQANETIVIETRSLTYY